MVHMWAMVPAIGMPKRRPASTFDVPLHPAT
jgi:hypothetical protein